MSDPNSYLLKISWLKILKLKQYDLSEVRYIIADWCLPYFFGREHLNWPISESIEGVTEVEVEQVVSLSLEGEHRSGAQPHTAVHTRREVHAQER